MFDREAEYEYERSCLANIEEHGWHVVAVADTKEKDSDFGSFAYSVGLTKTYLHPEVCVFGLEHYVMAAMINEIAELVKNGKRFDDWLGSDDILEQHTCIFRKVEQHHYSALFGFARWFNGGDEFSMLQCVWPDKSGRFPWNCKSDSQVDEVQCILNTLSDWPFPIAKNTCVITTRQVVDGELPVRLVAHIEEGKWQFNCGTTDLDEDGRFVSLGHIAESDPTILEIANLPVGGRAVRESVKDAWIIA